MSSKSNRYKFLSSLGAIGLVVYGFFVAQAITLFIFGALAASGLITKSGLESTVTQFIASFVAYALALLIILGIYSAVRNSVKGIPELLGVVNKPKLNALLYVLAGYFVYFFISFVFMILIHYAVPGFNIDESQEVGFDQLGSQLEFAMAFLALVVLAPLVEEAIFRGFLFTRLRRNLQFWWTALIVSLVFGLVHMQWNVGVDVFALSLVLCYVREKTGSIWAGVGIHTLKNAIAFSILFMQFDIEKFVLQVLY
ncbi:MAG: type II CAAX endopeptidase family protein [Patescibacteria group bacterium]